MNQPFTKLAASFILLAVTAIGAAAQCGSSLRAEVPFDFHVSDTDIPAGVYHIEWSECSSPTPMIIFRHLDGKFVKAIPPSRYVNIAVKADVPSLHFERFGSVQVLTSIRLSAGRYSAQLQPTRHQRQLAKGARSTTQHVTWVKPK